MNKENEFCCKTTKEDYENKNYHSDLIGMKFKHMKSPCVDCLRLFHLCQMFTLSGEHNDPTCKDCCLIKKELK